MEQAKPIEFSQITKALSKRVREIYPDYPIYLDYVESNIKLPCFVLRTTGGSNRKRITQGMQIRNITNERFTLDFYSLDMHELQKVGYELRMLLDCVETDDGRLYRCFQKNSMMAITENHVALTFRMQTEPYIVGEDIPKMMSLDLKEKVNG